MPYKRACRIIGERRIARRTELLMASSTGINNGSGNRRPDEPVGQISGAW
ncbi:MAG: hypothetical protein K8963_07415 [Proteobacteria bacterium]|nr:hypothetical protein [Pseudomonadota bacterium]